jgi:hypothetical protein
MSGRTHRRRKHPPIEGDQEIDGAPKSFAYLGSSTSTHVPTIYRDDRVSMRPERQHAGVTKAEMAAGQLTGGRRK